MDEEIADRMAYLAKHRGAGGHAYGNWILVKQYYQENVSFREACQYLFSRYHLLPANTHCLNKIPDAYDKLMSFNPYWHLDKMIEEGEELKRKQQTVIKPIKN